MSNGTFTRLRKSRLNDRYIVIMIGKAMKINDVLRSFGDNFNFNAVYEVKELVKCHIIY